MYADIMERQASGFDPAELRGGSGRFLGSYLPFLLDRAYRLLSEKFHGGLADLGLDITECRILTCLADRGPLLLQQIQMQAHIAQPTASRACMRLERRGLITRRVGTSDRRSRIMGLTDEGRDMGQQLMAISTEALAETLPRTTVDPEALSEMLRQLIADLEQ